MKNLLKLSSSVLSCFTELSAAIGNNLLVFNIFNVNYSLTRVSDKRRNNFFHAFYC